MPQMREKADASQRKMQILRLMTAYAVIALDIITAVQL